MPRLNVMGELRAILESVLGGVPVQVGLPGERPGTVVVVRRCGGARQDALVDSTQVEVIMWAPTEARSYNDTATTENYTLSLHDALPISI